jgi:ubiquitin C-terminal hydrolase
MKGFINIGNTCYLNSGLQMLLNIPEFCKMIIKNKRISKNMKYISKFIETYNNDQIGSISPIEIKKMLEERNDIFEGTQQQDSAEFLIFFFDLIDSDIKNNILYNNFGINTTTITKCKILNCLNVSTYNENRLFLILDINENFNTLDDCYRNYKLREKLDGDNKYYCEKCKKKRIASKRTEINKWPKNIIINLKRFEQTMYGSRKNDQEIECPYDWRHGYKLVGGVYHSGGLNSGHYIYFGKKKHSWYYISDSNISEVGISKINQIKDNAYLLHYRLE